MATLGPNRQGDPSPDVRRLQRLLSDAEEVADAIALALDPALRLGPRPVPPPEPAPFRPPRRPRFDDPRLRELARPGIGSIAFRAVARGSLVSIDGAEEFLLAPKAADLLRTLAQREGRSDEGFAPWVPLMELAAARGCQGHAVTVAIGRLQRALLEKGHKTPLLIETRPGAVRVRLRRPSTLKGTPPASASSARKEAENRARRPRV